MSQNKDQLEFAPTPHGLVLALCWLFAGLYGVWMLPETVFIRHFCMVAGAILSLYIVWTNRFFLYCKRAWPIWLVLLLLIWVTIHLLFIGKDYETQWDEYSRIWKKISICIIFAIGLGFGVMSHISDRKKTNQYWRIIFLGFLLPTIMYYIKLVITMLGHKFGFAIPIYLLLDPNHMWSQFGISRAWYVFFCLPAAAISIGFISNHLKDKAFKLSDCGIYLATIPLVFLIFYIENDRLGTFFGFLLIVVAVATMGVRLIQRKSFISIVIFSILLFVSILVLWSSFKGNPEWKTLIADSKVAIRVDDFDNWKDSQSTAQSYPLNEFGQSVGGSNYLRISWAIVGGRFVLSHPLGYGLLSLSFGRLGSEAWPGSQLSWSHSAWLDFTLGYGIPGFLLLFFAVILSWKSCNKTPAPWYLVGCWVLPMMSAVFLVKEISSEIFINAFIFLIVFSSALSLGNSKCTKN